MPPDPSPYWWPLLLVSGSIVGIGAVWFTRWVIERLEKERTRGHQHATKLQVHELRLDEHEDAIKDLKDHKGKR